MITGIKIGSKTFSDYNRKKAYLSGSKFIAKFIKYEQIYFTVEEVKNSEIPTFIFSLYTMRDTTKSKNHYCSICKEFHNTFYINEFYNCNSCTLNSFLKREKEDLNISKSAFKKKIQR